MSSYCDLLKLIDILPKGNIYKKMINGKPYYYHQFFDNGKRVSAKIKKSELSELKNKINERKEVEQKLNEYKSYQSQDIKPSKQLLEYTGYLMSGDVVVAEFNKGELIEIRPKKAPIIVKRTHKLEPFLRLRSIDNSRHGSTLLKEALNIKEVDDEKLSIMNYALTVTDNYWFKPKNSKLKYKDVCLKNDMLFDLSLKGDKSVSPNKMILTPELTTGGSYEKGWRHINNHWWLYKVGTKEEIFSELFYSRAFEIMGLNTAHYEREDKYIKTLNFAEKYNYEPMASLFDDNEDYETIYLGLKEIDENIANDYLRMIYFDVVFNNVDRHNENCGLLRDKRSGKIIALAPNFDDNLSLISKTNKLNVSKDEGFLKYFMEYLDKHRIVKDAFKTVNIKIFSRNEVRKLCEEIDINVDINMIVDFIDIRSRTLLEYLGKTRELSIEELQEPIN